MRSTVQDHPGARRMWWRSPSIPNRDPHQWLVRVGEFSAILSRTLEAEAGGRDGSLCGEDTDPPHHVGPDYERLAGGRRDRPLRVGLELRPLLPDPGRHRWA